MSLERYTAEVRDKDFDYFIDQVEVFACSLEHARLEVEEYMKSEWTSSNYYIKNMFLIRD